VSNGTCSNCGHWLDADQPHWHRLCWQCWRAENGRTQPSAAALEARAFQRGYAAGYAAGTEDTIDHELVSDCIQLSHPDRHPIERREFANRVTAELLRLRDRIREAA